DVADNKQQVTVNLRLTKDAVEIEAAGTAQTEAELAAYKRAIPHLGAGRADGRSLGEHLARIKAAYPKSDTVLLTPEPGLSYATMIQVMDAARELPPAAGPSGP